MTPQAAKLTALALLIAAGLLAVALAAGLFAPARVGAHPCATGTPPDMHEDFQAKPVPCSTPTHQKTHEHSIEVDGGRFRDMTFKAYVPSDGKYYDSANDSIVITFHRSFDLPDTATLTSRIVETPDLIKVDDNGSDADSGADADAVNVPTVSVEGKILTLTGGTFADGSSTVEAKEYITITIKAGAQIETPETPQGFDDFEGEEPYEVFITFVDGDLPNGAVKARERNFVIVKNPIDSTVPNTAVRVELATYADAEERISTADDIIVDFSGPSADSGFVLPSSMATSRIKVFHGTSNDSFNPSEVQIEGERVIFSVPTGQNDAPILFGDDYRIEFSKLARIRTPFSAGIKTIRVSSTVDGDEEDIIEAVVRRTTTVNPKEGPRGSEFTLEGKGYAPGTVTVYHDSDADEEIDPGETLASVKTVRGAFKANLIAGGNHGEEQYRVRARDSEGDDVSVGFDIRSAMSFEPPTVGLGARLKITISDWEEGRNEVVAVQIAGEIAFIADAFEYENCIDHPDAARRDSQGRVTLTVDVPPDIPPGEQTVAVYDHGQLDYVRVDRTPRDVEDDTDSCHELGEESNWGQLRGELDSSFRTDDPIAITKATVEIVVRSLTLSPDSAARGQAIVVTGSGFSPGGDIERVTIGGVEVAEDASGFEVESDGRVTLIVTVPEGLAEGEREVRVEGAKSLATGTLTIPAPSLALDPAESRRGSTVRATGSGFIANRLFQLTYGDGGDLNSGDVYVGAGRADNRGNISLSFEVPLTARIGVVNRVTAVAENGATEPVSAEADHSLSPGGITVTPESVLPGDTVTIRGENLPAFALVRPVRIGGRDVTPVPNTSVDRNGAFEIEVTVPQIELGEQMVRVEASGVILTHIIEISEPPRSGPTEDVFRELIRAGVLVRIWQLEPSDQSWTLFDPREDFAEFNTLTEVNSGEFVWINLNEPLRFQGDTLAVGWNIILLK